MVALLRLPWPDCVAGCRICDLMQSGDANLMFDRFVEDTRRAFKPENVQEGVRGASMLAHVF